MSEGRLLVVVAHPDDETFGCGSLILEAVARGYDVTVACATRGELGESAIEVDDLAAVRERELRTAAAVLGVQRVELLGWIDSGPNSQSISPGSWEVTKFAHLQPVVVSANHI